MKFLKRIKKQEKKQTLKRKTSITLLLIILTSCFMMAQQKGINYKALIKDADGNSIANQQVAVLLTIEQGVTLTNVYSESHLPITDTNGIIILTLGEGTVLTGDYDAIDWAIDDHYLNTKINIGSGIVDLGSVQFQTVPYALSASNVGLEPLEENNLRGWRLKGQNPENYGNIGNNAVDLSISSFSSTLHGATGFSSTTLGYNTRASGIYSTAMGSNAKALEDYSTAMGTSTEASGEFSTVMGYLSRASGLASAAIGYDVTASGGNSIAIGFTTLASGENSTAMGSETEASGISAIAMGANTLASATAAIAGGDSVIASAPSSVAFNSFTHASGYNATALGTQTDARAFSSLAIGRFNIGDGTANSWIDTDPVFEIGIGDNISARENAMTVLKNGYVGIGTDNPTDPLHVVGRLRIGTGEWFEDGGGLQIDARGDFAPASDDTFNLGTSGNRWDNVYATNGIIQTSDRRDKINIKTLAYGLEEIMRLKPTSFNWKKSPNNEAKLGLIAQDLLQVIPEVVKTHEWKVVDEKNPANRKLTKMERMGVNYADLIPVLIKAIQEQQDHINTLKIEVDVLKTQR